MRGRKHLLAVAALATFIAGGGGAVVLDHRLPAFGAGPTPTPASHSQTRPPIPPIVDSGVRTPTLNAAEQDQVHQLVRRDVRINQLANGQTLKIEAIGPWSVQQATRGLRKIGAVATVSWAQPVSLAGGIDLPVAQLRGPNPSKASDPVYQEATQRASAGAAQRVLIQVDLPRNRIVGITILPSLNSR